MKFCEVSNNRVILFHSIVRSNAEAKRTQAIATAPRVRPHTLLNYFQNAFHSRPVDGKAFLPRLVETSGVSGTTLTPLKHPPRKLGSRSPQADARSIR